MASVPPMMSSTPPPMSDDSGNEALDEDGMNFQDDEDLFDDDLTGLSGKLSSIPQEARTSKPKDAYLPDIQDQAISENTIDDIIPTAPDLTANAPTTSEIQQDEVQDGTLDDDAVSTSSIPPNTHETESPPTTPNLVPSSTTLDPCEQEPGQESQNQVKHEVGLPLESEEITTSVSNDHSDSEQRTLESEKAEVSIVDDVANKPISLPSFETNYEESTLESFTHVVDQLPTTSTTGDSFTNNEEIAVPLTDEPLEVFGSNIDNKSSHFNDQSGWASFPITTSEENIPTKNPDVLDQEEEDEFGDFSESFPTFSAPAKVSEDNAFMVNHLNKLRSDMEKTFSEVFGILKDINDLENSTEILNLDRSDDEVWEILHSEKHDSVISIGQFWDKSKTKDYLLKILSVDPRDMVFEHTRRKKANGISLERNTFELLTPTKVYEEADSVSRVSNSSDSKSSEAPKNSKKITDVTSFLAQLPNLSFMRATELSYPTPPNSNSGNGKGYLTNMNCI